MTKKPILALACVTSVILAFTSHSPGQSLTGTSLSVSGTGVINALVAGTANVNTLVATGSVALQNGLSVSGTTDVAGNILYFGAWADDLSTPGIIAAFCDGSPSLLKWTATRPVHEWLWERSTADRTATIPMMKLDSGHRLNLFGTSNSSSPKIVMDPEAGQITVNGVALGQGTGFGLISAGVGSTANTNSIAVGNNAQANGTASAAFGTQTIANGQSQLVVGQYNIASGNAVPSVLSPSDALFIIGNGSQGSRSNALTVNAAGQLALYSATNSTTPGVLLDPASTGTSQFQGAVLLNPQGDVGMGQYATGTQTNSGHVQVFPTGIQVTGTSTISGKTNITGTLDLTGASVLGVGTSDGSITSSKLADGSVTATKLATNAVTVSKLGVNEQKQLAKAWVRFNGAGTILSSCNVSSVVRTGAGYYVVYFTTTMPDANYCIVAVAQGASGVSYPCATACNNPTTTSVEISAFKLLPSTVGGGYDPTSVSVVIFGN